MLTDLRTSARQLLRSPIFTAVAVITLMLAIAAATTVFAVYNAVVYRPSLTMDYEHVFQVYQNTVLHRDLEPIQIDALRKNTPTVVEAFAARAWRQVILQSGQRAMNAYVEVVNGDLGSTFRIRPWTGRLFDDSDEAAGVRSAIVSAALWQRWFGGRDVLTDRDSLRISGTEFRVIGVMPVGVGNMGADVWITDSAASVLFGDDPRWALRPRWTFVRTRGAVTPDALTQSITASIAYVSTSTGERSVRAFRSRGRMATLDLQVLGIAALLVVAACANLTNLVYARIAQRRTEVAVRLALGAGRLRVMRAFVAEVLIVTLIAAIGGYGLAVAATRLIETAFPTFRQNQWGAFADLSLDLRVVVFSAAIASLAAVALSIMAALSAGRTSAARALAASGGPMTTGSAGRRFRHSLVSLQVTVALVLVMGAGLWLLAAQRSIDRTLEYSDFRYETGRLATLRVDMTYQKYSATHGAVLQGQVLEAARRLPEVEAAALTSGLPGVGRSDTNRALPMYLIADTGERILSGRVPAVQGSYAAVSDRFLETIGLPLLKGRGFRPTDVDAAPLVMLVSESVAAMLFPGVDAIGQRILFNIDKRPREIVGIFRDPLVSTKERWMAMQNIVVLVPIQQHYRESVMLVVRSDRPDAAREAVASALAVVDPQLAVFDAASVEQALLAETAAFRAATKGLAVLGALSLLFAALGIYGVMSFFVSTRVREFGIRLALGASPRAVLLHVFGEARLLLLVGLLLGVFLMASVERLLDNRIVRMMPNAVEMWIVAIALVLVTGLVATYFPARRASRTDPIAALREL